MAHLQDSLQTTTDPAAIRRGTAIIWAVRALSAYRLAEDEPAEQARWRSDAEAYRKASIEHAAMTGDIDFLEAIVDELRWAGPPSRS